jgi:hypothetical protein
MKARPCTGGTDHDKEHLMTASAAVGSGRTAAAAADRPDASAPDARPLSDAEKFAADGRVEPSAVANHVSTDDPLMTMTERIRSDKIH